MAAGRRVSPSLRPLSSNFRLAAELDIGSPNCLSIARAIASGSVMSTAVRSNNTRRASPPAARLVEDTPTRAAVIALVKAAMSVVEVALVCWVTFPTLLSMSCQATWVEHCQGSHKSGGHNASCRWDWLTNRSALVHWRQAIQ